MPEAVAGNVAGQARLAEPERRSRPRLNGGALVGGGVLTLAAIAALLAPLLAPSGNGFSDAVPLLPPGPGHPLGTNDIGQDVLGQWLWGARASLVVAALVAFISVALSWTVGIVSGLSRQLEAPLMAATDLLLALPPIPLYLLVVALVGASQRNVVLALGLLSWPAFARVVRSQVLALRGQPYVEAARGLGASPLRVAVVHVLPGTLDLLPAKLALTVRFALFAEATLAFLGLGDPAAISWGSMLGAAFGYPLLWARGAWLWWALPPAAGIVAVVLGATWLSIGLERRHGDGAPQAVESEGDEQADRAQRGRRVPALVTATAPMPR